MGRGLEEENKVTAFLYIISPLEKKKKQSVCGDGCRGWEDNFIFAVDKRKISSKYGVRPFFFLIRRKEELRAVKKNL